MAPRYGNTYKAGYTQIDNATDFGGGWDDWGDYGGYDEEGYASPSTPTQTSTYTPAVSDPNAIARDFPGAKRAGSRVYTPGSVPDIQPSDPEDPGYLEYLRRGGTAGTGVYEGPLPKDMYTPPSPAYSMYRYTPKVAKTSARKTTLRKPAAVSDIDRRASAMKSAWAKFQMTPVGSRTETRTIAPEELAPEYGPESVFEKPAWDERKISRLAQKKAAPGLRRLRTKTQQALSASYENPNVKAMVYRQVMAGTGQGLEDIMGGAEQTARAQYGQEYQADYQAATMQFQAAENRRQSEFQATWQNYLSQYTKETTTSKIFPTDPVISEMGIKIPSKSEYMAGFSS